MSPWNHGPTSRAQIDTWDMSGFCVSVASVLVRCFSIRSRTAKFRVFLSLLHPWCYFSADEAPSPSSTPPPSPFPSLLSLGFLRCASSCVAPSDPTARNTCKPKERGENREQLVSLLPTRGKRSLFCRWS